MLMRHHGYFMDNYLGGFGIFGIIWIVMCLALVIGGIVLVVYIIRKSNEKQNKGSTHHAIHILQERFARGEIDEMEYKEKKQVLEEE